MRHNTYIMIYNLHELLLWNLLLISYNNNSERYSALLLSLLATNVAEKNMHRIFKTFFKIRIRKFTIVTSLEYYYAIYLF